ncbi:MAG: GNAT family N-acetyltransferase [Luteitalea sp.]|nr:GNAT family N-acetyltransferase [Luteitalea sp.]
MIRIDRKDAHALRADVLGAVGAPVGGSPARRPERVTLEGRHVTLVPLDPSVHGQAVYEATHGQDADRLWRYLATGPYADRTSFYEELERKVAAQDSVFFVIVGTRDSEVLGYASYLRIEPVHRVIEVGNILYTPRFQGTTGATEAMYLMARHVFEELGYRRYEWKCNALNLPSRSAAVRLGFTFEGTFRQHMIIKGRNRDTAWYSMVDSEWPSRKAALEGWLAPTNFDAAGRQKQPLSAFRADSANPGASL